MIKTAQVVMGKVCALHTKVLKSPCHLSHVVSSGAVACMYHCTLNWCHCIPARFPAYLLCFEVGCVRGRKRTACVEVEGDNMQLITGP